MIKLVIYLLNSKSINQFHTMNRDNIVVHNHYNNYNITFSDQHITHSQPSATVQY